MAKRKKRAKSATKDQLFCTRRPHFGLQHGMSKHIMPEAGIRNTGLDDAIWRRAAKKRLAKMTIFITASMESSVSREGEA